MHFELFFTIYAKIDHKTHFPFDKQELRIEDYEAGRKTEVVLVCTSTGSLFGNTSGTGFGTSSSLTELFANKSE